MRKKKPPPPTNPINTTITNLCENSPNPSVKVALTSGLSPPQSRHIVPLWYQTNTTTPYIFQMTLLHGTIDNKSNIWHPKFYKIQVHVTQIHVQKFLIFVIAVFHPIFLLSVFSQVILSSIYLHKRREVIPSKDVYFRCYLYSAINFSTEQSLNFLVISCFFFMKKETWTK